MQNVKVGANRQTDQQTNRQGKNNMSPTTIGPRWKLLDSTHLKDVYKLFTDRRTDGRRTLSDHNSSPRAIAQENKKRWKAYEEEKRDERGFQEVWKKDRPWLQFNDVF
ncbi:hypothetical protein DPMN_169141 [Dreissena polymorpha]|uniref:Uncharacterized protein n=1 Tax=Dreissena polymorpha TaxID=45954 RepID=A0A9D4F4P8_DREPO|nr:hypothetical protein DPMN_169141 [Dreissena polymorpha]